MPKILISNRNAITVDREVAQAMSDDGVIHEHYGSKPGDPLYTPSAPWVTRDAIEYWERGYRKGQAR